MSRNRIEDRCFFEAQSASFYLCAIDGVLKRRLTFHLDSLAVDRLWHGVAEDLSRAVKDDLSSSIHPPLYPFHPDNALGDIQVSELTL